MASITKYFANGTHAGAKETIWVPPVQIGSGQVTDFAQFVCSFAGHVKVLSLDGDLNLTVELMDHNPDAASGQAVVKLKFKDSEATDPNAKYHVDGSKLVFESNLGGNQTVKIFPISTWFKTNNETEIDLSGKYNYVIHLVPA